MNYRTARTVHFGGHYASPGASMMLRGATIAFAPDDDSGHATEETKTDDKKVDEQKKDGPTDAEATLLKDVMRHKTAAKAAKDEADAANAELAKFSGVDVARYRELVAAADEADRKEAEKRGEYDRIINSMREQSDARLAEKDVETSTVRKELEAAQKRIDELTLGSSFGNSKFIAEETVLTPAKARKLYDDHFDIENGEIVAYDKPRGAAKRTPLVDERGDGLSFEAAIERIVKSDPDYERFGKSKLKSGAGSSTTESKTEETKVVAGQGRARIAAALQARKK